MAEAVEVEVDQVKRKFVWDAQSDTALYLEGDVIRHPTDEEKVNYIETNFQTARLTTENECKNIGKDQPALCRAKAPFCQYRKNKVCAARPNGKVLSDAVQMILTLQKEKQTKVEEINRLKSSAKNKPETRNLERENTRLQAATEQAERNRQQAVTARQQAEKKNITCQQEKTLVQRNAETCQLEKTALEHRQEELRAKQTENEQRLRVLTGQLNEIYEQMANLDRIRGTAHFNQQMQRTLIETQRHVDTLTTQVVAAQARSTQLQNELTELRAARQQENDQTIDNQALRMEINRMQEEYQHLLETNQTVAQRHTQQTDRMATNMRQEIEKLQRAMGILGQHNQRLQAEFVKSQQKEQELIVQLHLLEETDELYKQTFEDQLEKCKQNYEKQLAAAQKKYEEAPATAALEAEFEHQFQLANELHENKFKELQEENVKLLRKQDNWKGLLRERIAENRQFRAAIETLQQQLQAVEQARKEANEALEKLTVRNTALATELKQLEEAKNLSNARLEAEHGRLKADNVRLEADNGRLITELNKNLLDYQQELARLMTLVIQNKDLPADVSSSLQKILELETQLLRFTEEASQSQETHNQEKQRWTEKMVDVQNKLFDLYSQMGHYQRLSEQDRAHITALQQAMTDLQTTLQQKEQEITHLKEWIRNLPTKPNQPNPPAITPPSSTKPPTPPSSTKPPTPPSSTSHFLSFPPFPPSSNHFFPSPPASPTHLPFSPTPKAPTLRRTPKRPRKTQQTSRKTQQTLHRKSGRLCENPTSSAYTKPCNRKNK